MLFKNYASLPDGAKYVRTTVFVDEQGFREEFDSVDEISTHIVALDGEKPVGTVRFYYDSDRSQYIIGRLAVIKEYRGGGLGKQLVAEAERLIKEKGGDSVLLHAQCRVRDFYGSIGYQPFGEIDYDEDCPHIWMQKSF